MKFFLDSNTLIYFLHGTLPEPGMRLVASGMFGQAAYSVISRIEILGFSQTDEMRNAAVNLLSCFTETGLTDPVVDQAIDLRSRRKIKVPDAIIAASALVHQMPLVTHNTQDFRWIDGLTLMDPLAETIP